MSERPGEREGIVGRGAGGHLPNRFEHQQLVDDFEHLTDDDPALQPRSIPTEFLPDGARSLIRSNDSPDVAFSYSVNPYRGCEHGCSYCYARPGHETLGMDAAIDFETKILIKHDAPDLLRKELNRRSWRGEPIILSGVTDCYQPIERKLKLTRSLLEVMHEAHQPVSIVTKNALVVRDLDLLAPMASRRLVQVNISLTTLDAQLGRTMEPRTSSPEGRLKAIRALSEAGVPVRAMLAPMIPGLTDQEIPALLTAAQKAGARAASYLLLRLPLTVRPVFLEWLHRTLPDKAQRVESMIRQMRGGRLSDSQWGRRMKGEGFYAEQIGQTFKVFATRLGLRNPLPELDSSQFRPPTLAGGQMRLF